MYLPVCSACRYGDEKDGKSHCQREAVYSYLSNCIQKKALEYYLGRETVGEKVSEAV